MDDFQTVSSSSCVRILLAVDISIFDVKHANLGVPQDFQLAQDLGDDIIRDDRCEVILNHHFFDGFWVSSFSVDYPFNYVKLKIVERD